MTTTPSAASVRAVGDQQHYKHLRRSQPSLQPSSVQRTSTSPARRQPPHHHHHHHEGATRTQTSVARPVGIEKPRLTSNDKLHLPGLQFHHSATGVPSSSAATTSSKRPSTHISHFPSLPSSRHHPAGGGGGGGGGPQTSRTSHRDSTAFYYAAKNYHGAYHQTRPTLTYSITPKSSTPSGSIHINGVGNLTPSESKGSIRRYLRSTGAVTPSQAPTLPFLTAQPSPSKAARQPDNTTTSTIANALTPTFDNPPTALYHHLRLDASYTPLNHHHHHQQHPAAANETGRSAVSTRPSRQSQGFVGGEPGAFVQMAGGGSRIIGGGGPHPVYTPSIPHGDITPNQQLSAYLNKHPSSKSYTAKHPSHQQSAAAAAATGFQRTSTPSRQHHTSPTVQPTSSRAVNRHHKPSESYYLTSTPVTNHSRLPANFYHPDLVLNKNTDKDGVSLTKFTATTPLNGSIFRFRKEISAAPSQKTVTNATTAASTPTQLSPQPTFGTISHQGGPPIASKSAINTPSVSHNHHNRHNHNHHLAPATTEHRHSTHRRISPDILDRLKPSQILNHTRILKDPSSQIRAVIRSPKRIYQLKRVLQSAIYGGVFQADFYDVGRLRAAAAAGVPVKPNGQAALKIMLRAVEIQHKGSLQEDIEAEKNFYKEMQGHRNVLAYDELWEDVAQSICYVAMPFAEFEDLFEVLRKRRVPFGESEARWLFKQLLEGVHYLHTRNVGFRDHSLENVLMFRGEDDFSVIPKITDPGQAIRFHREAGRVVELPTDKLFGKSFRPPEVYFQSKYNPVKIDVFCMGWMLFFVVTKRQPFDRAQKSDPHWPTVEKGELAKLLKVKGNVHLTAELIDLLTKMLHPNPETRFDPQQCLNHKWFQQREICPINVQSICPKSSGSKSTAEVGGHGQSAAKGRRDKI